jgi:hypothetical protein
VGANPGSGAAITYYLKKRHIFGKLKLEILDASRKVIKTLPSSKRRGINRVYWNMRLKRPKTPSAPGLPRYFSFGPKIDEGIYTIRLTKGKKEYTGKLEVIADPISGHSKEDRKLRHLTVMKLYNLQEDLGFITENVSGLIKQIDQITKTAKSKKIKNRLKTYKNKLDAFHKTLVEHGGIMTGEKLRGKVMSLYSSVIQFGGKPTDSQLYYFSVLQDQVKGAEKIFNGLTGKEFVSVNSSLKTSGFKALKLMTKEEYRNKE